MSLNRILRRLTDLSLVDVEWDVDLRMNRYRLSSVVADWLAEVVGRSRRSGKSVALPDVWINLEILPTQSALDGDFPNAGCAVINFIIRIFEQDARCRSEAIGVEQRVLHR